MYARPEYLSTLDTSTPASAHVKVDLELYGCPIDRRQLLDTVAALLVGRKPDLPGHSVCFERKARDTVCVLAAHHFSHHGPLPLPLKRFAVRPGRTAAKVPPGGGQRICSIPRRCGVLEAVVRGGLR